jgi:hypothetical protein
LLHCFVHFFPERLQNETLLSAMDEAVSPEQNAICENLERQIDDQNVQQHPTIEVGC